jgi:hypothetical protein
MLDFIFNIFSTPSLVKWALEVINSAILFQSLKSLLLSPNRGYFAKKGIIILLIFGNLVTIKFSYNPLVVSNLPQLKKKASFLISIKSLLFCVI